MEIRLSEIKRNRGEYILFEENPGDPNIPHVMRADTDKLFTTTWLKGWFASTASEYTRGTRRLTKEEVGKIISALIPSSKSWSITEKTVVSSFIPCPCCSKVSLIIHVTCQGQFLRSEADKVEGWYRLDISALKGGHFKTEARRLIEETPFVENIIST